MTYGLGIPTSRESIAAIILLCIFLPLGAWKIMDFVEWLLSKI